MALQQGAEVHDNVVAACNAFDHAEATDAKIIDWLKEKYPTRFNRSGRKKTAVSIQRRIRQYNDILREAEVPGVPRSGVTVNVAIGIALKADMPEAEAAVRAYSY